MPGFARLDVVTQANLQSIFCARWFNVFRSAVAFATDWFNQRSFAVVFAAELFSPRSFAAPSPLNCLACTFCCRLHPRVVLTGF